jgi:hypothetical protein
MGIVAAPTAGACGAAGVGQCGGRVAGSVGGRHGAGATLAAGLIGVFIAGS